MKDSKKILIFCFIAFFIVLALWFISPVIVKWAVGSGYFSTGDSASAIGDQFGLIGSLFSALAFVALLIALLLQRGQLKLQEKELRAQIEVQRLTAILSNIPGLIRDEESRLVECGYTGSTKPTLDALQDAKKDTSEEIEEVVLRIKSPKAKIESVTQQLEELEEKKNSKELNQKRNSSQGACLWFTGLPCSGKTTATDIVADRLRTMGKKVERLDGDIVRKSLTRDLGFSKEDRDLNIERITFVAKLLSRNGVYVLTSFVSPHIEKREHARCETTNFIEVYLKCPLKECMRRDVKGMYKKAIDGKIENFTGISDPYEEPPNPEIILDTKENSAQKNADKVIKYLKDNNLL